MGTQQILLIVLSVIIVGAAIAVGITMFNNQAYSANKSAVAAEAQSYATQIVQYYKTPESQGGAGRSNDADATEPMSAALIAAYIGWDASASVDNDTGIFTISNPATLATGLPTTDAICVSITGVGKESKGAINPQVVTSVGFPSCEIVAVVSDGATTTSED